MFIVPPQLLDEIYAPGSIKLNLIQIYYISIKILNFWTKSHQGSIYLIKNTVKKVILWNIIRILNDSFLF